MKRFCSAGLVAIKDYHPKWIARGWRRVRGDPPGREPQRPALDASSSYTKRALPAERKMEQQRPESRPKNKSQQPDGESAAGETGQFGISSLFSCRASDVHLESPRRYLLRQRGYTP